LIILRACHLREQRQRRRDEREAAALAAANIAIEAREEKREEAELLAANWVADIYTATGPAQSAVVLEC
jgi:hypothetical protein